MTARQASSRSRAASGRSGRPSRPFVGRRRELGELREALDEAAAGHGVVVVLTGEPGIGKTRLLQEAADRATADGWGVFTGRCWEEGGAPAYWPWIQVVRATGGDFADIAARSASAAGEQADPESVRFALFDAVARFLLEHAEGRPVFDRARRPARRGRAVAAPASVSRRGQRERSARRAVLVP
jgi:dienelactone hydrolase